MARNNSMISGIPIPDKYLIGIFIAVAAFVYLRGKSSGGRSNTGGTSVVNSSNSPVATYTNMAHNLGSPGTASVVPSSKGGTEVSNG